MFEIKPKTRKEIYMAYLAGDMSLELPEPMTRDEVYLYYLCINGDPGGGLPSGGGGVTNYYMFNGKLYHDIECNNGVTKEEAVNAFKNGGVRVCNYDFTDMVYGVVAIDGSEDWARLFYMYPDMEADCWGRLSGCTTVEFKGIG